MTKLTRNITQKMELTTIGKQKVKEAATKKRDERTRKMLHQKKTSSRVIHLRENTIRRNK